VEQRGEGEEASQERRANGLSNEKTSCTKKGALPRLQFVQKALLVRGILHIWWGKERVHGGRPWAEKVTAGL